MEWLRRSSALNMEGHNILKSTMAKLNQQQSSWIETKQMTEQWYCHKEDSSLGRFHYWHYYGNNKWEIQ